MYVPSFYTAVSVLIQVRCVHSAVIELSLDQISGLKEIIPFLKEEGTDSKILEFHQIWLESFPEMKPQLWAQKKRQFKLFVSSDFLQVSWYMGTSARALSNHYDQHLIDCVSLGGVQAEFIQGMVDFFWNVGAPESEIDKLNDVGAICNPMMVGSWIDMSKKGGMDGGWYFPVDIPIAKAFEAADKGHEAFRTLKAWTEKHNFTSCYSIKVRPPFFFLPRYNLNAKPTTTTVEGHGSRSSSTD